MRMRHKKNLDTRLEAVSDYLITLRNESLNFNDAQTEEHFLDTEELFGNSNPVYLEVGCGMGTFASTYAEQNPDINMLCVEKVRDVICTACEKAKDKGLKNIKFLDCSAEYLPSYLRKNSISGIFLNFSCPYPKKSHACHRLTSERFLNIYRSIMTENSAIYQKTDNMHFFEFSIESFSQNGFKLSNISLDLHNSDFEGNIVTEYEARFSSQGYPIYRLEARL
mgnify:CR=1 FL=1